ncbi:MAG: twin-arginine translocase subunit TatC [Actinobacteria bacterium]|nr:twin-arginine translocase subunit TatC [Actinomycetota bacterium]
MRWVPRRLRYGEEATLVEHLGELRSRLTVGLLALTVGFGVAFAFHSNLIHWLNHALPPDRRHPITLSVAEPFLTSVMVSIYAGFVVAMPIILWQVWSFFAPAMQEHTQRIVAGFALMATVLLAGGIAFGYWIALPAAVHFLTNYDDTLYNIQIRARDYYSFAALVLLAMAVVFELPIFILGLVRLGIVTAKKLRTSWRVGIVAVTALAVALPGVDPVTTLIELAPLLVLYFLTVVVAAIFEKRWRPQEALEISPGETG